MIEIIRPGWQSLIVDGGRFGRASVGVPSSSALDRFACRALNLLTGHSQDAPLIEALGKGFALKFHRAMTFAITGARVSARLDDRFVRPWVSVQAPEGSLLHVDEVLEGFRYYIGFSGTMDLEKAAGSYSTNLECGFGGYQGRTLKAKDRIAFSEIHDVETGAVRGEDIPPMHPPHVLRVVAGPESSFFTQTSLARFMDRQSGTVYDVGEQANRTGIRMKGEPLVFRPDAERSIISEGILPGTVQIPGDGQPIIMLNERTIGGYARVALVVKADQDRLAHLKPGDAVLFKEIGLEAARDLWERKNNFILSLGKTVIKAD
jgi:antagonist of KipI